MPTAISFGEGTVESLTASPMVRASARICMITAGHVERSGLLQRLDVMLSPRRVTHIGNVPAQPSLGDLEAAVAVLRDAQCDCVVAVGGGSVLDLGKAAALCVRQPASVADIFAAQPAEMEASLPVVAIPTTAGTGSEVTPFVVFWDTQAKKKYSLGHSALFPREALLDPALTSSLPSAITAATGMDAFTQACEAYWNRHCNPVSDDYALMAVARIANALPVAVRGGTDAEARRSMLQGSLWAGLAFSNTRTAACHSISYPLTLHFGVVHGQAVGITLPEVLLLNATVEPARAAAFCSALGVGSIEEAAEHIRRLMHASGLATRLSSLGIGEGDVEVIVREGFTAGRMMNNPYTFDEASLRALLLRIL